MSKELGVFEETMMFDVDEYFHLALHASSTRQHHACMTYLKELLQLEPNHAPALYLLAAQHAELGLRDRAVRGMRAALAIDPELEIVRLQLGLLLMDANRHDEAREGFVPLSASADAGLRSCADAMLSYLDGDARVAAEKLTLGLTQPTSISALTPLMQGLLARISQPLEAATTPTEAGVGNVSLGAYQQASR